MDGDDSALPGEASAAEVPPNTLTVQPAGWVMPVARGQSLLEAAQAAGIHLPRSCRNGSCRACRCRMLAGQVDYRVAWPGLSTDEHQEGWVLPCVALPRGDVMLDVPGAVQLHRS